MHLYEDICNKIHFLLLNPILLHILSILVQRQSIDTHHIPPKSRSIHHFHQVRA